MAPGSVPQVPPLLIEPRSAEGAWPSPHSVPGASSSLWASGLPHPPLQAWSTATLPAPAGLGGRRLQRLRAS